MAKLPGLSRGIGRRYRTRSKLGIVRDAFKNSARAISHFSNPVNRLKTAGTLAKSGYRYATTKREKTVPDEVRSHAQFAKASYGRGDKRLREINGAVLNPDLSSSTLAVYTHPDTNKHHISIRGTDPKNVGDLADDVGLVSGRPKRNSHRMQEISHTVRQLGGDKDNITLYGHSLGGALADAASVQHGIRSHNFNPGMSPVSRAHNDLSHNYLIAGDPVSNFGMGDLKKGTYTMFEDQGKGSAHTIDQFL